MTQIDGLIDFLHRLTMYVECASPETRKNAPCGPDVGCIPCEARALLSSLTAKES
jgi:hypothetical protein